MKRPERLTPCHRCGNTQLDPVMGLVDNIHHCTQCERPICDDCADFDADCIGDPPTYVGYAQCKGECDPDPEREMAQAEHMKDVMEGR